jgi:manganese-dependent inorganic pyrophosphatase
LLFELYTMATYILGHEKPDLDSIVSAIALAEFKSLKVSGEFIAGRVGEVNPETDYILKKFKTKPPKLIKASNISPEDKIILVDHNEEGQRLEGLNPKQIIEIVDHHYRIDFNLNQPIKITILPWGATSTIIFSLFEQKGLSPTFKTAQLILAAILSDTVGLKSPTTQKVDRETVTKLQKITKLKDLKGLIFEQLKAKSNISDLTPTQVVTNDYKIFNFSGKKVFINQLETVEQENVLKEKEKYLSALEEAKQEMKLDLAFFAITDILKENTKMLYLTPRGREVLEKAFREKGKENVIDVGPRLSRKKQMAPEIEQAVKTS